MDRTSNEEMAMNKIIEVNGCDCGSNCGCGPGCGC